MESPPAPAGKPGFGALLEALYAPTVAALESEKAWTRGSHVVAVLPYDELIDRLRVVSEVEPLRALSGAERQRSYTIVETTPAASVVRRESSPPFPARPGRAAGLDGLAPYSTL